MELNGMPDKCLIVSHLDGIARLTLDAPHKRNALSEGMMAALSTALSEAAADPAVRVIVLAANGPVFCSGHDLKEMTAARTAPDKGRSYYQKVMATCSNLMQSIVHHPKPVIGEIGGIATAAGCQLIASCDLAITGKSAQFSTPGVHIGLFCSTPMVALSRNVSRKHAMEMLLTGDMISAERAAGIGLVNQVVEDGALGDATMAMARKIADKSVVTVKIGKKAFYEQIEMPLAEAYAHASAVMVENMLHREAQEGIGAFIEKRAPKWEQE